MVVSSSGSDHCFNQFWALMIKCITFEFTWSRNLHFYGVMLLVAFLCLSGLILSKMVVILMVSILNVFLFWLILRRLLQKVFKYDNWALHGIYGSKKNHETRRWECRACARAHGLHRNVNPIPFHSHL